MVSPAAGCEASHYGPGCMKTCMCGLRPCDPTSGECLCPSGTHGPSCLQGESGGSSTSLIIVTKGNYSQSLFACMDLCSSSRQCAPRDGGERVAATSASVKTVPRVTGSAGSATVSQDMSSVHILSFCARLHSSVSLYPLLIALAP